MTSPQEPAREERWQVEELPGMPDPPFGFLTSRDKEHRLYVSTWAGVVLADYLNALERERKAYRQALEKFADKDVYWNNADTHRVAKGALSSAGS